MPSKSRTTITERESSLDNDAPAVLAYRVGELEKTTSAGLKEIRDELIRLSTHFVTKSELIAALQRGDDKHVEQDRRIEGLESWNLWAVRIVLGTVATAVLSLVLITKNVI